MRDCASGVTVPPQLLWSLSGSTLLLKGPGLICPELLHEHPPKLLGFFRPRSETSNHSIFPAARNQGGLEWG